MQYYGKTIFKSSDEKEKTASATHNMSLENRKLLTLSGVTDVDSFDESVILLYTQLGELTIKGSGLHINTMSVDTGDMTVEGDIWSLVYGEKDKRKKPNIINKLFR